MKEKFLPWFMLFCALGLSGTAAYYSVVGLSIVFVGVALPVIIMGSFLEISKIAIATYLHDKWKETYGILKIYLSIALIILSIITSLGIYGLLSTGFQGNIAKLEINEKQVKNIEVKKKRFDEVKVELTKEKTTLDGDITKLRDGLSNNTTTQSVDRKTGQVVTRANDGNRKSFEGQLSQAQVRRDTIAKRIDNMNDSITKLDVDILNMESEEISGSELGALKYVSELLDWDIKRTANLFILILIFVFDPLAITLVIATNQAFKSRRKEDFTPQVEDDTNVTHKEETDQVTTKYRLSTDQVKRVWDRVKKLKKEGKLPEPTEEDLVDEDIYEDDYDENIDYLDKNVYETNEESIENDEIINEDDIYGIVDEYEPDTVENKIIVEEEFEQPKKDVETETVQEVTQPIEPVINRRLSYTKNDTGNFKINRI